MSALRTAHDIYPLVDELGPRAVGELFIAGQDGARGAVFIERGRVCWAAAHGLAPRLSQLLVSRALIPPPEMESIFRACKAERTPLGEHLIRVGVLRAEDLRSALLQHTVESVSRLCASPAYATWSPRPGKGYSPTFTFTTAELLAYAGGERHRTVLTEVGPVLEASFDSGWGAAFVRTGECAFPEPIAVFGSRISHSKRLLRIGQWAASALDVVSTFNDPSAVLAVKRGASSMVTFWHGNAIVVGETGEHGPALILNRRARERLRNE
ncbi:MAG: hypothetical protein U0270_21340 [Labilithrix sp.]